MSLLVHNLNSTFEEGFGKNIVSYFSGTYTFVGTNNKPFSGVLYLFPTIF